MQEFKRAVRELTPFSEFTGRNYLRVFPPQQRILVSNCVGKHAVLLAGHADIVYDDTVIHLLEGEKVFIPEWNDFEVVTNGSSAKIAFSA